MREKKALVVFSGGQDSTTCMFHAMAHYDEVELVTFEYGQRHSLEISVAKQMQLNTVSGIMCWTCRCSVS